MFQSPKITPSERKLKFIPKYIEVGDQRRGIRHFLKDAILLFGYLGPHAKFQNSRITPSGRKLKFTTRYIVVGGERGGIRNVVKGAILFFLLLRSACKVSEP